VSAPTRLPLMQDTGHDPHWNLVVRHRAGSLASQMSAMRRRDLAVSGGVLLLLVARDLHGVAFAAQAIRERHQQRLFVFDQQDPFIHAFITAFSDRTDARSGESSAIGKCKVKVLPFPISLQPRPVRFRTLFFARGHLLVTQS